MNAYSLCGSVDHNKRMCLKRASNLNSIKILTKELEEVKLEKDGLEGKLAGLLKALKNLDHLIESQRPSPTVVSTSAEGQNKDSSTSEDVASPNPPKPFVKFVKPKNSKPESKSKEQETPKKSQVKYAEQYRHSNKKPKGNQRNWNNLKSYQLGSEFVMHKKPCFNCGDFSHLANDCRRRVQRETTRSQKYAYENPSHRYSGHRPHGGSMRPLHRSAGHIPHGPSMNLMRPTMNGARPYKSFFIQRNFPTTNRKFPTASRKFTTGSTKNHTADVGRNGKAGSSQNNIDDKEWKQYATMMRHKKNLMDINIDALYNILKQNQGDLNEATGSKKKTVVVTSDPLALIAEKTNVSRSKEKVIVSSDSEGSEADDFSELKKITSLLAKAFNRRKFYSNPTNNNLRTSSSSQSANKKQEFVKTDNKIVEKKDDEKKRDLCKVKCYNCKKEGHFAKDCKKAKVKDYEYYKKKMLLAKKDKDEQVLLAKDQAWMESRNDSNQEINENMVFMAQIDKVLSNSEAISMSTDECESEYETLEYYDNSTSYGLFVNNDDDQEIFHDAIESASENLIENHINSQKDYDKSDVDQNDYEEKEHLGDKLIRKFNKKIVKCQNRVEKANQQSKDFENQNKDLQDKYDAKYAKLEAERYEYMIIYYAYFDNDKQHKKQIADQQVLYDKMSVQLVELDKHINFEDDYIQKIINPDFEKIDSPFQQTSSLKPYVPNVILEKIIIDLEDEVVNLLEKEKVNFETIEYLKSKCFELSEKVCSESENQSENDCLVVEKECDKEEKPKVIAPGMFKLNVSQCVSPISMSKSSCDSKNVEIKLKRNRRNRKSSKQNVKQVDNDVSRANNDIVHFSDLETFSSVRRPRHRDVISKKKWSSNTSNDGLSDVIVLNWNKNVKRYSRKDLLACNNSHLGETSSASMCNDAMNVSCNSKMNDLLDDNNFFIFDDVNVRISPISKMPFRKKPRDSMHVRSKSNMIKSLPRTMHKWLPKLEPLAEPVAKWFPRIVQICLWIIDLGCSKHMTGNRALLTNFVEKFLETGRFGKNDFAVVVGYRDVVIAKDLRPTLYDEKDIGLGYNPVFLTHSDEALEIEKFKRSRENKIEFAYDYRNLNASYVNEKINFKDDYFQEIINPYFEKIDSPFQQKSLLKPYVPNVILEKIIIDLEDGVVNLLEKEKLNLEILKYDKEENPKVIAPGMFKLNVLQCVSPISMSKSLCDSNNVEIKLKRKRRKRKSTKQNVKQVDNDVSRANNDFVHFSNLNTFSSVRRPKNSGVIWKKKGSSNTSNVGLSAVRMNDLLDDNNFFIFDDS
nr:ribonuclease H-like domain-containing protein [Tanacetum cinerariifolium]